MRSVCLTAAFVIGFGCFAAAAETPTSELVAACDRAAASPFDKSRPAGVAGVANEKIEPDMAIQACEAAAKAAPSDDRIAMQLGRGYLAACDSCALILACWTCRPANGSSHQR